MSRRKGYRRQKKSNSRRPRREQHRIPKPKRVAVKAITYGQQDFLDSIRRFAIVYGTGPAGTGKTHLATGAAISCVLDRDDPIERIIFTRPTITVAENIGYLPGTQEEKVKPYTCPFMQEVYKFIDRKEAGSWVNNAGSERFPQIEVVPMGFMRGWNMHDCFVVCDEMQNSCKSQLKMLLTRFGKRSKMVLTGDVKQTDLDIEEGAGDFAECIRRTKTIPGFDYVKLGLEDCVRSGMAKRIAERLDNW